MPTRGFLPLSTNVHSNARVIAFAKVATAGDVDKAVGHLSRLWGWALDNAEDGELGHMPAREIARIMNWPVARSPQALSDRLLKALLEAGLLQEERSDRDTGAAGGTSGSLHDRRTTSTSYAAGSLQIHDWEDYAGLLLERRKRDRVRKKEERLRKRREREERERLYAEQAEIAYPSAGRPRDATRPPLARPSAGRPQDAPSTSDRPSAGRPNAPDPTATRSDRTVPPEPPIGGEGRGGRGLRQVGELTPTLGAPLEGEAREERLLRLMPLLAQVTDETWRKALEDIACRMTVVNFETWFPKTTLERRDGWAIVRAPNAFAVEWLTNKYRGLVAEVLATTPSRVLFAKVDQDVVLEPEPVDEEASS